MIHDARRLGEPTSFYALCRAPVLGLWLATLGTPAVAQEHFAQNDLGIPAASASGPDAPGLQPLVDRIAGSAVGRNSVPGLIVGVSWRGRRSYFAYSGTGGVAFGPETIVEIGSITKVFTTALFAEALAEGRMQRDAPIQSYMPARQLKPCTAKITPLQLADFTSGMPELPANAPRQLSGRGIDHYTSEDFLTWVSRWTPANGDICNLPAPYLYSNASVGLLGILVAERLGGRWEDLIQSRITGPLRMMSTAIKVRPDERNRLAPGYGADGKPVIPWPVFAWYAAGALRSSATDMLAFGEAALGHETIYDNPVPPALIQALKEAMSPIYQPEGQSVKIAMAWVENPGDPAEGTRPIFFKTGGTDGFNSVVVINPGKDLAIFIAASSPSANIQRLGVELSRLIRQ